MAGSESLTAREAVREVMSVEHADVLRESVAVMVREIMEAKVAQLADAELGERAPGRCECSPRDGRAGVSVSNPAIPVSVLVGEERSVVCRYLAIRRLPSGRLHPLGFRATEHRVTERLVDEMSDGEAEPRFPATGRERARSQRGYGPGSRGEDRQ